MHQAGFEVVFVCTGNRARSPLAEALLRRAVRGVDDVHVRSVGTEDVGPLPALPGAVRAGLRVGIDLSHHRATPLRRHALEGSDLVVGFEPGHVSAAVIDGRADMAKTFSLIELGELLDCLRDTAAAGRPDATIEAANARRAGSFLTTVSIADPNGKADAEFVRTLDEIERHVTTIAEVIFGARPGG